MKIKPFFFLVALSLILVFILGVRYGQKVEKNNKVVNYILSITPYPTYTPYPTITEIPKISTVSPTIKMKL